MIKSTCKTVCQLALIVAAIVFVSLYTASTSNVPKLFNNQLIHRAVRPLLGATFANQQRNASVQLIHKRKLPSKPEMVRISNRKRHLLQVSETNANSQATQVDQRENEVSSPGETPNRSLISVDGAVDPKNYSNDELDRLYGDALLVYMKNFNDTLPARKDVRYVNGTRVPIFRSRAVRVQN